VLPVRLIDPCFSLGAWIDMFIDPSVVMAVLL